MLLVWTITSTLSTSSNGASTQLAVLLGNIQRLNVVIEERIILSNRLSQFGCIALHRLLRHCPLRFIWTEAATNSPRQLIQK